MKVRVQHCRKSDIPMNSVRDRLPDMSGSKVLYSLSKAGLSRWNPAGGGISKNRRGTIGPVALEYILKKSRT